MPLILRDVTRSFWSLVTSQGTRGDSRYLSIISLYNVTLLHHISFFWCGWSLKASSNKSILLHVWAKLFMMQWRIFQESIIFVMIHFVICILQSESNYFFRLWIIAPKNFLPEWQEFMNYYRKNMKHAKTFQPLPIKVFRQVSWKELIPYSWQQISFPPFRSLQSMSTFLHFLSFKKLNNYFLCPFKLKKPKIAMPFQLELYFKLLLGNSDRPKAKEIINDSVLMLPFVLLKWWPKEKRKNHWYVSLTDATNWESSSILDLGLALNYSPFQLFAKVIVWKFTPWHFKRLWNI